jgi:multimeric flavodoxin WrbA
MAKKILILTGSPRRNGNSDALAEAFTTGAEKAGAEVRRVNTAELKIGACIACEKCWENDKPCIFQDDMEKIYPLLEWAEMFVLAFPLYYYTFPSQLKLVLDRLFPYAFKNTEVINGKDSVMLVCAETDNPADFDGVVSTYKIVGEYLTWNDKGVICAPGLGKKEDILNTNWQELAQKLGESLG